VTVSAAHVFDRSEVGNVTRERPAESTTVNVPPLEMDDCASGFWEIMTPFATVDDASSRVTAKVRLSDFTNWEASLRLSPTTLGVLTEDDSHPNFQAAAPPARRTRRRTVTTRTRGRRRDGARSNAGGTGGSRRREGLSRGGGTCPATSSARGA
jgi:hypothetical protein